jgi:hypothetical protein
MVIRLSLQHSQLAFTVANSLNDTPPTSETALVARQILNYERELAGQYFNNAGAIARVAWRYEPNEYRRRLLSHTGRTFPWPG